MHLILAARAAQRGGGNSGDGEVLEVKSSKTAYIRQAGGEALDAQLPGGLEAANGRFGRLPLGGETVAELIGDGG